MQVRYPPRPQLASFDALGDSIFLGSEKIEHEKWWNRLTTMSYVRPAESSGAASIAALNRWLEHGLELSGGKDALGFLFLYELMTNSLAIRILPSDSPYILGALLVRAMPARHLPRQLASAAPPASMPLHSHVLAGAHAADA